MTKRSPIHGVYWLGDLEIALGEPGRCILDKRPQLEAAGFPLPLPRLSSNERLRWRASEVDAWIEARRNGAACARPANDRGGVDGADEARRAHLLASM